MGVTIIYRNIKLNNWLFPSTHHIPCFPSPSGLTVYLIHLWFVKWFVRDGGCCCKVLLNCHLKGKSQFGCSRWFSIIVLGILPSFEINIDLFIFASKCRCPCWLENVARHILPIINIYWAVPCTFIPYPWQLAQFSQRGLDCAHCAPDPGSQDHNLHFPEAGGALRSLRCLQLQARGDPGTAGECTLWMVAGCTF